jgi:ubiquinone/menaquinone biosynthesis C-methylase UbiE
MKPLETNAFTVIRKDLVNKAKGKVLEIGCGTGINFPLYESVQVSAIEPNAILRKSADLRAHQARVPIDVMAGNAEQLEFEDNSFDTVVGTLVFCTIPNPGRAIKEVIRVCKPQGKILLFEHIRHENKVLAALQEILTPIWKKMCDGCHLNRNTEELFRHEGIEILNRNTYLNKIFITIEARNLLKLDV